MTTPRLVVTRPRRASARVRVDSPLPLYPLLDAAGRLSLQFALMLRRAGRPFLA